MPLKHRTSTLSLLLTTLLAACGGGGDEQGLALTINYEPTRPELFLPMRLEPAVSGLAGNAPHCEQTSGALPPGIGLATDCSVSGTPTTPGIYQANVALTVDGQGGRATSLLLLTVDRPSLSLPPGSSPYLVAGQAAPAVLLVTLRSFTTAPGRTATFEVSSGALPTGLSIDATTSQLIGTPSTAGDFSADLTAVVSQGGLSYRTAPVTVLLSVQ